MSYYLHLTILSFFFEQASGVHTYYLNAAKWDLMVFIPSSLGLITRPVDFETKVGLVTHATERKL